MTIGHELPKKINKLHELQIIKLHKENHYRYKHYNLKKMEQIYELHYYYYYYFGVRCARPRESEGTLSVQRPQPNTTNPWKEEKDKTVRDKIERADHANRKALALL